MTDDEGQFSESHHDDSSLGNLAFVADQKTNITRTFFWKTCWSHSCGGNNNLSIPKGDEVPRFIWQKRPGLVFNYAVLNTTMLDGSRIRPLCCSVGDPPNLNQGGASQGSFLLFCF